MLDVLYPILLAAAVADAAMALVGWLDRPRRGNEKRRSRSGAREQRKRVS